MDCKIIYKDNKKVGVYGLDNKPSETFQEILNNGQVKDFEEALQIYKGLYSDKIELPKAKVQNSGFFSNAEQSLLNLKDKNVKNVQGWIKALTDVQKNGGIKNVNQELEWIGLEDYLNEYVKENNPKAGNIPSSVVEDYIKSNQIEIVDVSKGGDFKEVSYQDIDKAELIPNDKYGGYYVYYKNGFIDKVYGVDSIDEAIFQSIRESNFAESDSIQPTKYEAYQLKGGEVYREVLLTMPSKRTDITEAQKVLEEASLGNLSYDSQEVKDAQKTIDRYNSENKDEYSSSHWSEKNILAHVRLNEKTLPDGRRVLILNEIQADISQDLKKEQDKILDRVDKEFDNFLDNLIMNKVIIEEC